MSNIISIPFQGESITLIQSTEHKYLLSTFQVASGYGVDARAIRDHKSLHADELREGVHFLTSENVDFSGVEKIDAYKQSVSGMSQSNLWTLRGVIRLGSFIKSKRGIAFRDWAEDIIFAQLTQRTESSTGIDTDRLLRMVEQLIDKKLALASLKTPPTLEMPKQPYCALVQQFIKECTEPAMAVIASDELYKAFTSWCAENHYIVLRKNSFGRGLTACGVQRYHTAEARLYQGITLKQTVKTKTWQDYMSEAKEVNWEDVKRAMTGDDHE